MTRPSRYDLVVIGAGSAGLTAAGFAARIGARVALVEGRRIGGDCTWTGCVPSKALLRAARAAHEARTAARFGVDTGPVRVDMRRVRDRVQATIAEIYSHETPERLAEQGIDVVPSPARFLDARRIQAGERVLEARRFLIATGARPIVPEIPGLSQVPYLTYERVFELDELPERLIVIGGGPIGMELSQAFARFGAEVTVVAQELWPREEPEVRERMLALFSAEGIRCVAGAVESVAAGGSGRGVSVRVGGETLHGDRVLLAVGRLAVTEGLDLYRAGVETDRRGIVVRSDMRTSARNVYAAGDVAGGAQFTHLAGWQGFQAARNALLPGRGVGLVDAVPWTTFTEPEVARVGPAEDEARRRYGDRVRVSRWEMSRVDRAVCEDDRHGFIKLIHLRGGRILGATVVSSRAGETLAELVLAMNRGVGLRQLAGAMHPYPTWGTGLQQIAARAAAEELMSGALGRLVRFFARRG